MKQITIISTFLLFLTSPVLAQKNVTLGKPYVVIDADQKYYFTQHGEILTVKVNPKSFTLQKLNAATLTFQKIKLYDDFPKGYQIERIVEIKSKQYVFYSLWNGDNEQLFYREIDFGTGSFVGVGKKIITVTEKIADAGDKFDFYFSYDSSAIAIQYRLKPESRNDSKSFDKVGMHVFDANLQQQWGSIVTMPYTEKKMDNLDYSVDAKGNVYIVSRVYNDNTTDLKKRGEDDANYHLEILKVEAQSGKITSTPVAVADKFIDTIWLYETAKGFMICGGFYNNGKASTTVDGVIVFKLSPDNKMYDLSTHEIPLEIINEYTSRRERRKNERKEDNDDAEFTDLRLQQINVQEDGSIILLSEQRLIKSHNHYNSTTGRSSTSYTYHCNNILVSKITAKGTLAWMKKIPKRQQSGAGFGGSMSYHYFRGDKEHYFMYLDNEENLNLPTTEQPAVHADNAGGFLMACKINDESGVVTKTLLLNTRDVNGMELFQFQPGRMMATAPSTIVFEAYKKKKEDILVKIVLE